MDRNEEWGSVTVERARMRTFWKALGGILGLLALFVVLSVQVFSQAAVIDGQAVPLVSGGGESLCIMKRNPGLPENWGNNWTPEPWFFDSVDANVPGMGNLVGGFQGNQVSGDRWSLVRPTDYHYRNWRNGKLTHPAYTACATRHFIDGGATLYFRFVPKDDPWEERWLSKLPLTNYAKALAVCDLDEARISKWPWLQKVLGWYVYDASSLDINAKPGTRNMSWLLVPANFMKRWGGHPGGLPAKQHWYGLGTTQAGVSLSNEHYGSDFAWLAQGIRKGDVAALNAGLYLLRQKIAYGLIDTDKACSHKGRWRNESGDNVRGTAGIQPSAAKEYDLGLCVAQTLLGGSDPLIDRGFNVRAAFWKSANYQWSGSGGARNLGRALQNLHAFYEATGDPAFKTKAEQFITWAFSPTINGMTRLWFKESKVTEASAGEGVSALAWTCRWVYEEGLRADLKPHLQNMIGWYFANCQSGGRCGYFVDPTVTPARITWSGEFQGLNWLALRPYLSPTHASQLDAIEARMFTIYAGKTDCDACYGGEGPGWEKWVPWIVLDGARR